MNKFIADFEEKLSLSHDEADELYNQCMEVIVGGFFKKK